MTSTIITRTKQRRCPRGGYIRLVTNDSDYIMPTKCKTWGCDTCKHSLRAKVKNLMRYPYYLRAPLWLITNTYAYTGKKHLRPADCVKADFKRFLRMLRSRQKTPIEYMQIPELTQNGQIHLHTIFMGFNPMREDNCLRRPFRPLGNLLWSRKWLAKRCGCMAHEMAKLWLEITGDSFIVDVEMVYDEGYVAYTAKYLVKGLSDRDALEEMGYGRRYLCSQGWPRERDRGTKGTIEDSWVRIQIIPRTQSQFLQERARMDANEPILQKERSEIGEQLYKQAKQNGRNMRDKRVKTYGQTDKGTAKPGRRSN